MYMPSALEVRGGYQIPKDWSYRQFLAIKWVLGIKLRTFATATVLLADEPTLQPTIAILITNKSCYLIYLFMDSAHCNLSLI